MSRCDFNKVAFLCNLIEATLRHECSPVNLLHIFRKTFPKIISGRLLLNVGFEGVLVHKLSIGNVRKKEIIRE